MRISRPAVALVVAMAVQAAHAADVEYAVNAGVGRSDNITRVPDNEQSATMGRAGLDIAASEQTRRLRASGAASLEYLDYFNGVYDSEVVGNLNAQAALSLIPERLEWLPEDAFGQVRRDPFQAVTPNNRENINYLSTGPELTLNVSSATRLRLSGRYGKVNYEKSPFDNERYEGGLSLLRTLAGGGVLSANVQTESVNYGSLPPAQDYDRDEAYMGYLAIGGRTRLNAELGYSKLKQTGADSSGLLARLEVHRTLSSSQGLSVRLGREFTDAGGAFRLQQQVGGVNLETQSTVQTPNPFTNEYVTLGWDIIGRRTGINLTASQFRESYELVSTFDRDRTSFGANVYRDLSPSLRAQLGAIRSHDDFRHVAGDMTETTGTAQLQWRAGRELAVSLRYEYSKRSTDIPGTDYSENRMWLQFSYGTAAAGLPPAATTFPVVPGP